MLRNGGRRASEVPRPGLDGWKQREGKRSRFKNWGPKQLWPGGWLRRPYTWVLAFVMPRAQVARMAEEIDALNRWWRAFERIWNREIWQVERDRDLHRRAMTMMEASVSDLHVILAVVKERLMVLEEKVDRGKP